MVLHQVYFTSAKPTARPEVMTGTAGNRMLMENGNQENNLKCQILMESLNVWSPVTGKDNRN